MSYFQSPPCISWFYLMRYVHTKAICHTCHSTNYGLEWSRVSRPQALRMTHHSDGKQEAPWGVGVGGGSQKDATPRDNSLPTKAVLLFSTTRQHPNTACLITPSERKTGAEVAPWCHRHLRHHVTKSYKYNHRLISTWPLVQVMGGGFKAPNPSSLKAQRLIPFSLFCISLERINDCQFHSR